MMAILIISSIFFSTSLTSGKYEVCFAHAVFMVFSVLMTQGIHTSTLYIYNIVYIYIYSFRNMQKLVCYSQDHLLLFSEYWFYISLFNAVSLEYGMISMKV